MDVRSGREAPDPALEPHLERGESVLWQARPAPSAVIHAGYRIAFGLCCAVAVGLVVAVWAGNPPGAPELGIAMAVGAGIVAVSGGLLLWGWLRARGTLYALTDRRLLTLSGGRIVAAHGPEEVHGLHETPRLGGHADLWWQVEPRQLGWRGVPHPAPIPQILDWRNRWLDQVGADAAAFVEAARDGRLDQAERLGVAQRIAMPAAGVAVSAPAGWPAAAGFASDDEEEPGVPIDYAPPGWDALLLRPPVGAVRLRLLQDALPGFDEMLEEDDAIDRASSEREVRIGPWRGFSLVTPSVLGWGHGAPLPHGGRWIEQRTLLELGGGRCLELTIEAPAKAEALGAALSALRASLRPM